MIEMPTAANPVVVLHGDSYEILKQIPDGAFDHSLTDPPYSETTHAGARSNKGALGSVTIDFKSMTSEAFVGMWRARVAEFYSKYMATAVAAGAKQ